MHSKRIVFIGGGNMASALLAGLAAPKSTASQQVPDGSARQQPSSVSYDLRVADPGEAQRKKAERMSGVSAFTDNIEAIDGADCIIFAVKPQIMQLVCAGLAEAVASEKPLLVSVAAGIGLKPISRWFGGYRRIVRAMPNTPALVGAGATGLFADSGANESDIDLVEAIFSAVGVTAWVDDEALIDAVIAVSGSGPAYFFYMLEAMEDAGTAQGLPRDVAQRLARQTALGAAQMALSEPGTLAQLRHRVTSPGGTTEAALDVLAKQNWPSILDAAMAAAHTRAKTLADEFGRD